MTKSDEQDLQAAGRNPDPAQGDDRRGEVKPSDNPRPSSPEADEAAVREGEEKLRRVKPY